jgi:hypothetical protein
MPSLRFLISNTIHIATTACCICNISNAPDAAVATTYLLATSFANSGWLLPVSSFIELDAMLQAIESVAMEET